VRRIFGLAACVVTLAVPAAAAAQSCPTLAEIEREVICPTCNTTLSLSSSPIAERMRAFIRARIAACDSKSEIKAKLVAEFGEGVLAAPPKEGFNLLAWLLPLAGALAGALALGVAARRWVAARAASDAPDPTTNGRAPVDLDLERRLDEELARFDG
jgi:cytochrome c-type biogenesis protein CcmH